MTRHVNFLGLGFRLKWRVAFVDVCLRFGCGGETSASQSFNGSKLIGECKGCSESSKNESEKLGNPQRGQIQEQDELARISYILYDKSQQSGLTCNHCSHSSHWIPI